MLEPNGLRIAQTLQDRCIRDRKIQLRKLSHWHPSHGLLFTWSRNTGVPRNAVHVQPDPLVTIVVLDHDQWVTFENLNAEFFTQFAI